MKFYSYSSISIWNLVWEVGSLCKVNIEKNRSPFRMRVSNSIRVINKGWVRIFLILLLEIRFVSILISQRFYFFYSNWGKSFIFSEIQNSDPTICWNCFYVFSFNKLVGEKYAVFRSKMALLHSWQLRDFLCHVWRVTSCTHRFNFYLRPTPD